MKIHLFVLFVSFLTACTPEKSKNQALTTDTTKIATNSDSLVTETEEKDTVQQMDETKIMTIKAKFVEFALGDAQHFMFEDKSGKKWDFGDNEVKTYQFGLELPEKQATAENQGWTSNPKLLGKWFELKYKYKTMPLYLEGPIGQVPVIVGVTEVK